MTLKLSVSHRLRVTSFGRLSFAATGLESGTANTWFVIGAKRTTGAPTTIADLSDHLPLRFFDVDRGSYKFGDTLSASGALDSIRLSDSMSSALAGDHLYLLVVSGTSDPPASGATFDAVKALGTLQT